MLFFATFSEQASLLVDAPDETLARAIAVKVASAEPERVLVLATGVFVAEVFFADADVDEDVTLVVEPMPSTFEALEELEGYEPCGSEAELESGEVVRCAKSVGHLVDEGHEGRTASGALASWGTEH